MRGCQLFQQDSQNTFLILQTKPLTQCLTQQTLFMSNNAAAFQILCLVPFLHELSYKRK